MIEREPNSVPRGPLPLVRWSAVFAGTTIAVGAGTVLGVLWLALAYSSHRQVFYQHLDWWMGGTAILAMALAGFLAGAFSGAPGASAGLASGLTTWGLVVVGTLAVGIPTLLAVSNTTVVHLGAASITVKTLGWWPSFWSLLVGFGAAAFGGVIGGTLPRKTAVLSHRAASATTHRSRNGHFAEDPMPAGATTTTAGPGEPAGQLAPYDPVRVR